MKRFITTSIALLAMHGCGGGSGTSVINADATDTIENHDISHTYETNTTELSAWERMDENLKLSTSRALYLQNCATCHGTDGKSISQADIVGASIFDVDSSIQGDVPDMTYLKDKLSDEDITIIAYYLEELAKNSTAVDPLKNAKIALGEKLFFDHNLSLTKNMSCATCHDQNHAFIDARFKEEGRDQSVFIHGALALGDDGVTLGGRNVPTATYAMYSPEFFQLDEDTYVGGQFWDGRAKDLMTQAQGPFLDPAEMMMPEHTDVLARVQENESYVTTFKELYGTDIFDDSELAYEALAKSIAMFEKTETFATFDSKYDRSKLHNSDARYYAMSEQEQLGYELFFDQSKTHCSKCHTLSSNTESSIELFSNYQYENIGIPKNIEALLSRDGNSDTIDLGLGGRDDINESKHYGKFKVPTLRNVAVTAPYMRNGIFKELRTVVEYFNYMAGHRHTINPETGQTWAKAEVGDTVNYETLKTLSAMSDEEIDAVVAFLKTLTDARYEHLIED